MALIKVCTNCFEHQFQKCSDGTLACANCGQISEWEDLEYFEVPMEENIKDAIEACDSQKNCVECSVCYEGIDGDKQFIPCNNIRKEYGVSIWDYR